jgi:hypothetical protein
MEEIIKKTIIKMVAEEFREKVMDDHFMKKLKTIYYKSNTYYNNVDLWDWMEETQLTFFNDKE